MHIWRMNRLTKNLGITCFMVKPASSRSRSLLSVQGHSMQLPSSLPTEILIRILCLLHLRDLLSCRRVRSSAIRSMTSHYMSLLKVSKHILSIIEGTPAIQYLIELQVAGYEDCSQSPLNVIQRLHALRSIQDGWRKPRFPHNCFIPEALLRDMNHMKYFGNVFVGYSRTKEFGDSHLWNVVRCLCVESTNNLPLGHPHDAREFVVSDWIHEFDDEFEACAVDASQRLLVLLKYRYADASYDWWYEYVLISCGFTGH